MLVITLPIVKLMHDTAYLAITHSERVRYYLRTIESSVLHNKCSSVGQLRHLVLIILIWQKVSSWRYVDPKNSVKPRAIDRTDAANKSLYIETKKRLRSAGSPQPTVWPTLIHTMS